jgi:hypothetical protein
VQLFAALRVVTQLQKGIVVVGNGSIDVGKETATGKPGQPKPERARICGAMTQQQCDSGNRSAPQKFVQLVGCREPKARPAPQGDPRPAQVKG